MGKMGSWVRMGAVVIAALFLWEKFIKPRVATL